VPKPSAPAPKKTGKPNIIGKLFQLCLKLSTIYAIYEVGIVQGFMGISDEYEVLEETRRRLNEMPESEIKTKQAIVDNWEKIESEVRHKTIKESQGSDTDYSWLFQ
jgi:hypothetical protein